MFYFSINFVDGFEFQPVFHLAMVEIGFIM